MNNTIRIATRKSPLALWQAEEVKRRLLAVHKDLHVELVKMTTRGDQILDSPLAKIGGKGLFVKELELGMLEGKADIAVHSMKDVPVEFPDGLHLSVIMDRENPFDAFVSNKFKSFKDLPQNARIGTCSLRRQCQIRSRNPDFEILDLRGNVNTRLAKLDGDEYDAIILAAAGLIRLKKQDRIRYEIPAEISLPAVGQGAIGIESRSSDSTINSLISVLHDRDTSIRISAERAMNKRLNGGCQVPIAGFAEISGEILNMRGLVGSPDGTTILYSERSRPIASPIELGNDIAEDLLSQGAREILSRL